MAIPISALIASLLLFQRLSRSNELTALRASGLSLFSLLAPLFFISSLFSFLNFSICAEVAPFCKREARTLLYKETSENPLLLLQRQQLTKMKNIYIDMKIKNESTAAKDFTLVIYNERNQRLNLIAAQQLTMSEGQLKGAHLSLISHLDSEKEEGFDILAIENQTSMTTEAPALSAAMKKNRPRLETGALGLKMLRIKSLEGKKASRSADVEIMRRISLALSVFTFTFLGSVFGIEQGRLASRKNLLIALGLTLMSLLGYLLGKEMKSSPFIGLFLFFSPHLFIWFASALKIRSLSRGFV